MDMPKGGSTLTQSGNLKIDGQLFEFGKWFFRRADVDIVYLDGQQKGIDPNLAHVETPVKLPYCDFGRIPPDPPGGDEKPDQAVKANHPQQNQHHFSGQNTAQGLFHVHPLAEQIQSHSTSPRWWRHHGFF